MAVQYKNFEAKERGTKNGGVRPAYTYSGVVRESVRTDSLENLVEDLTSISDDLSKIADFVVEGFNSIAEKSANPLKDDVVKAVLAAMSATGAARDVKRAQEIAAGLKAQVSGS